MSSKRNTALAVTGLTLCALIACWIDGIQYLKTPLQPICENKDENGLWLRYYWYAGKHKSADDWSAMLQRLREFKIRYAYFHVLTTKADGTLKIHNKENALKITSRVHAEAPQSKPIAWIYVGAAPQPDGVDLSNPKVRKALIDEALWLVNDCNFDGIQWDYEFATNGNEHFLKLLDETRQAISRDKIISVDTPMYYPGTLWGWSDDYFKAVAKRCDQICVMCYDSYLYFPRAYAWLIEQEVAHITTDVAGTNCKAVFGLPSYEDVTAAHRHQVESLANSLRGLRNGTKRLTGTDKKSIAGVALFADYTTDENEWKLYRDVWLDCQNAE